MHCPRVGTDHRASTRQRSRSHVVAKDLSTQLATARAQQALCLHLPQQCTRDLDVDVHGCSQLRRGYHWGGATDDENHSPVKQTTGLLFSRLRHGCHSRWAGARTQSRGRAGSCDAGRDGRGLRAQPADHRLHDSPRPFTCMSWGRASTQRRFGTVLVYRLDAIGDSSLHIRRRSNGASSSRRDSISQVGVSQAASANGVVLGPVRGSAEDKLMALSSSKNALISCAHDPAPCPT